MLTKTNKITEQSAVDFIFEELDNKENGFPYFTMVQIYNKAKEMEKQQQGYSEEEVLELLNKSCDYIYDSSKIGTDKKLMPNLLRGWFEQFKKK